jgi:hypothetical protein
MPLKVQKSYPFNQITGSKKNHIQVRSREKKITVMYGTFFVKLNIFRTIPVPNCGTGTVFNNIM